MVSPRDIELECLIVIVTVLGLWSNVASSPNPLAKQNLQAKQPQVDLGYNSTAAEGVNEIVRVVVNLVKVSNSRIRKQLHGSRSNVTSHGVPMPVPHDGAVHQTMNNLAETQAIAGTHDNIMGGPSMVSHMLNSTTNAGELMRSPLVSLPWDDNLTCDGLQKEVLDLKDLESALMQLLDVTRKRTGELRNASMGNLHQNCFITNHSLSNNTKTNLTMTPNLSTTGGIDVDITEPIISLIKNETTAEGRDHKRQSLKEFTNLVTTLINTLQGMGQKVMMMQTPPKGTKAGNVSPGPSPIDMVCGDTLRKPSTMAEYVMGKHRRR